MTTLNNVVLFVVVLFVLSFGSVGSVSDSDGLLSFDSFGSEGLLSLPFGPTVVEALMKSGAAPANLRVQQSSTYAVLEDCVEGEFTWSPAPFRLFNFDYTFRRTCPYPPGEAPRSSGYDGYILLFVDNYYTNPNSPDDWSWATSWGAARGLAFSYLPNEGIARARFGFDMDVRPTAPIRVLFCMTPGGMMDETAPWGICGPPPHRR